MNIALWILQVLLAALFFWHGCLFLSPPPEYVEIMNAQFAYWFRMFLGTAEVLAAIGLILPGAMRVLPKLTPLAAVGLMIVTASATVFHSSRGETGSAIQTSILFALLTFLAVMRWKVKPITARQPQTSGVAQSHA
jgi:uncharacterized membrane protein YphA (DoxX/SURF4 family)